MPVVYDHAVADRTLRSHEQIDFLTGRHRDAVVVDEALELAGRHAAARDAVFVEVDDVAPSGDDAALLIAVRQEKILAVQPPVEERPVGRLVHDAEITRLADAQQRRFGRRHQPVFGVVVEEDLLFVARLVCQGYVAVGQQNLVLLLVRKV